MRRLISPGEYSTFRDKSNAGAPKMNYLSALRMFVRAVEVGSFSKAAIATNTKTPTVSRAIASLEEDLGVRLFHRRAHLTESRATFYEHARGVLRGWRKAECGLGNGGTATGIDPPACPERIRPPAHVLA
jgi:DNA-binding transcriptional LysR family regulator